MVPSFFILRNSVHNPCHSLVKSDSCLEVGTDRRYGCESDRKERKGVLRKETYCCLWGQLFIKTIELSDGLGQHCFFDRRGLFTDPDGIMLEFAGWTRALGEGEVRYKPATAADKGHTWQSSGRRNSKVSSVRRREDAFK